MRTGHLSIIVVVSVLLAIGISCRRQSGSPTSQTDVSREQLKEWMDQDADVCILDVRSKEEYESGHIPDAININYTDISARLDELEPFRNHRMVVYCRTGRRAKIAKNTLTEVGFEEVHLLIGDMIGWTQAGWPTESGN